MPLSIFDITHHAVQACRHAGRKKLGSRDVIRLAIVAACPWLTAQWEKQDPRCAPLGFYLKRPVLRVTDPDCRGPSASGLDIGYIQETPQGLYTARLWAGEGLGWVDPYDKPVPVALNEAVAAVIRVAKKRHAEPINHTRRD